MSGRLIGTLVKDGQVMVGGTNKQTATTTTTSGDKETKQNRTVKRKNRVLVVLSLFPSTQEKNTVWNGTFSFCDTCWTRRVPFLQQGECTSGYHTEILALTVPGHCTIPSQQRSAQQCAAEIDVEVVVVIEMGLLLGGLVCGGCWSSGRSLFSLLLVVLLADGNSVHFHLGDLCHEGAWRHDHDLQGDHSDGLGEGVHGLCAWVVEVDEHHKRVCGLRLVRDSDIGRRVLGIGKEQPDFLHLKRADKSHLDPLFLQYRRCTRNNKQANTQQERGRTRKSNTV